QNCSFCTVDAIKVIKRDQDTRVGKRGGRKDACGSVSVISRSGIILRYTRKGGGGPLEGEMEHEAREARPIGAQGAFVSNSMHYIYTPAPLLLDPKIYPSFDRETLPAKRASIRSLRCWISISFIILRLVSTLRNLIREICLSG
ncbi:hypothetical protein ALC62_01056, partial [Cyphomyrmex costatus]